MGEVMKRKRFRASIGVGSLFDLADALHQVFNAGRRLQQFANIDQTSVMGAFAELLPPVAFVRVVRPSSECIAGCLTSFKTVTKVIVVSPVNEFQNKPGILRRCFYGPSTVSF